MKQAALLAAFLLAALAPAAGAQGINLSLDDCGDYGTANAIPSCETNTGVALMLIGSVVPPAGMDRVVAVEAYIDGCEVLASALSPWWTLDGCRAGALTFGFDFTGGPFNCNDFWAGQASGGGGISPIHAGPSRFQIKLVGATPGENPMDPNLEHYVFRVNILRTKSTGAGACSGCGSPAAFVLNRVVVFQPVSVGDAVLTTPIFRNFVVYNYSASPYACWGVPARSRTWGQVKGLYR